MILDEILRVGDAAFREKAGSILERFRGAGKSIVLASLAALANLPIREVSPRRAVTA